MGGQPKVHTNMKGRHCNGDQARFNNNNDNNNNNNNNDNNNNNKSNLYSAIRHQRDPHIAVHSHNVHTNAICARMNLHETII